MTNDYIDHLKKHAKDLALRYLRDHDEKSMPIEFAHATYDNLMTLLTEGITQTLRLLENTAVEASVERAAKLIRYSLTREDKNEKTR